MHTAQNAIIKQVVGIDVAMNTLAVAIGTISSEQDIVITASGEFDNKPTGWTKLLRFCHKHRIPGIAPLVVMEATGVYHEKLAHHLFGQNVKVAVVLPTKIKHFALSLNCKSKTDRIDAETITRFGLER